MFYGRLLSHLTFTPECVQCKTIDNSTTNYSDLSLEGFWITVQSCFVFSFHIGWQIVGFAGVKYLELAISLEYY